MDSRARRKRSSTRSRSCRRGRCGAPSASAARNIPCSRRPGSWAGMCASASRTTSTFPRASTRRAMPSSSPRHGASSTISAAPSPPRARRARCWACARKAAHRAVDVIRVLNVTGPAKPEEFAPALVDFGSNGPSEGDVVVEIRAAGINPSDAKAMMGLMPGAVWPRTPGRDFAGVVIEGPPEWKGREVWGSGGDIGISRNGSHAERLKLPRAALSAKPANLSMEQAGTIGVPFVTAYEGLRRAGFPKAGDTVAVFGASGKVGQATVQLAARVGAQVFAVDRRADAPRGHAAGPVRYVDSSREKPAEAIKSDT